MTASATYHERLWPGPLGWGITVAFGLVIGLALFPALPDAAVPVGLAAAALGVVAVALLSPRVAVADGELLAGGAHIPVALLGEPQPLDRGGVRAQLGPGSDARTFAVLRSGLPGAVLVPVTDPQDPVPAWLVSSRRPADLAAAIARDQAAQSEQIG